VWAFVVAAAIGNMMWGAFSSLGPVVAERDLGGAAVWGTILGAMGVGALIGSLLAVRTRPRRPMVAATILYALFVLPLACLAAGLPVAVLAVGTLAGGVGMMFGNSIWESTLMRFVPGESLSRVSAYDWFGSLAFQPLGLAVWGPIAGLIGVHPTLWIATAGLALTNLWLLSVPAIRQLRA
jgi:hypothetical protein